MAKFVLTEQHRILYKLSLQVGRKLGFSTAIALAFISLATPQTWAQQASTQPSHACNQALDKGPLYFHPQTGKATILIANQEKPVGKVVNYLTTILAKTGFGLADLEKAAARFVADKDHTVPYFIRLAKALNIEANYDDEKLLNAIPEQGKPLLIVTNHPRNGVDGIALAALLSKKRNDVKIVLTTGLKGVPEMTDNAIFINTKGEGRERVMQLVEEIKAHLASGGSLIIFPSGDPSQKQGEWIIDPVWKTGIVKALQELPREDVTILPAFVDGQPGWGYRTARKIWNYSKNIGFIATSLMNLKEIAKQIDTKVEMNLGPAIPLSTIKQIAPPKPEDTKSSQLKAAAHMRTRSLLLRKDDTPAEKERKLEKIIDPIAKELIDADLQKMRVLIDNKPEEQDDGIQIFFGKGSDIPNVIQELGRLREITFREEGEGSGLSCDTDRFDPLYHHLIAYDKKKKKIMGAYRVGLLGDIVKMDEKGNIIGIENSYAQQFFNGSEQLYKKLPRTVELSRSFLIKEYQRHRLAFPYLLSGVAQMFVEHPEYEYLMGVVSISNQYSPNAQLAMIKFLMKHHRDFDRVTRPKTPVEIKTPISEPEWEDLLTLYAPNPMDFNGLDKLVGMIENDPKKKAPPLLGIYTESFGASFVGFNSDNDFNTKDGLIIVRVPDIEPTKLGKFMQDENKAIEYIKRHNPTPW